ncbi:MAG: class I SAM-dependent methyltransferase [Gemmatimonadota bacterium]|nr:class I SAM-dependent methyltransferase [Gemmatimonadota bacterium]
MLTLDGLKAPQGKGAIGRAVSFIRPYLVGVAGSAYLFSVGWIKLKNRAAIVELCHHFGYYHESREPREIPAVSMEDIAPADSMIDIRAIDAVDGNVSERELLAICRLVKRDQPERLFEFGTFDGRTTLNMAVNAAPGAMVFTLDLPGSAVGASASPIHPHEVQYANKPVSGERYRGTDAATRIVAIEGDSGTFDFSPYYGSMDFIFIDASHTFAYLVNDSLHALKMIGPEGGTIIWHDYGRWDGVTSALNELRKKHQSFASLAYLEATTLAVLRVPARREP